jgi:hypothetical protein
MKEVLPSDALVIAVEISRQQNPRTAAKAAGVTARIGLCIESARITTLPDAPSSTNTEAGRQNDARQRCPLKHPSWLLVACVLASTGCRFAPLVPQIAQPRDNSFEERDYGDQPHRII